MGNSPAGSREAAEKERAAFYLRQNTILALEAIAFSKRLPERKKPMSASHVAGSLEERTRKHKLKKKKQPEEKKCAILGPLAGASASFPQGGFASFSSYHARKFVIPSLSLLPIPRLNLGKPVAKHNCTVNSSHISNYLLLSISSIDCNTKKIVLAKKLHAKQLQTVVNFLLTTIVLMESWHQLCKENKESAPILREPLPSVTLRKILPLQDEVKSADLADLLALFRRDKTSYAYIVAVAMFFYSNLDSIWNATTRAEAFALGDFPPSQGQLSPFVRACKYLRRYNAYKKEIKRSPPPPAPDGPPHPVPEQPQGPLMPSPIPAQAPLTPTPAHAAVPPAPTPVSVAGPLQQPQMPNCISRPERLPPSPVPDEKNFSENRGILHGDGRQLEDDRKRFEDEQRKLAYDRKRFEGDQGRLADDRKRFEGEQGILTDDRKRFEDEQRRLADDRRRFEDDRRRFEDEQRRLAEDRRRLEEDRRLHEEQKQLMALGQLRLGIDTRRLAEDRRRLDEDRQRFVEDQLIAAASLQPATVNRNLLA